MFQGACRYARKFELQLEEAKKREAFLESRLYHRNRLHDNSLPLVATLYAEIIIVVR